MLDRRTKDRSRSWASVPYLDRIYTLEHMRPRTCLVPPAGTGVGQLAPASMPSQEAVGKVSQFQAFCAATRTEGKDNNNNCERYMTAESCIANENVNKRRCIESRPGVYPRRSVVSWANIDRAWSSLTRSSLSMLNAEVMSGKGP